MSEARIIDGNATAARLRGEIADRVRALQDKHGIVPGLAAVLVGEDPASQVYVRNKGRATVEVGMRSLGETLPATATQAELLAVVDRLNRDPGVSGILVQLPLPRQIDTNAVIDAIDPAKDVDGFHLTNVGLLSTGRDGLVPCTPLGCMILVRQHLASLAGKHAVVVGRSNIVGKPIASLLLRADCTVTIAHSKTADLPAVCRSADILIAAVGKAEMIRGAWVKPGATVIDVGINRVPTAEGKSRLVGDVAFSEAKSVAGAITPVPGGVGPMTIACLLRNTLAAAARRHRVEVPGGLPV
jgi:methylenetetrahydrofolate dehydrogenase (NADP+)/methenyltetrahydrofolate cyclohydrolase